MRMKLRDVKQGRERSRKRIEESDSNIPEERKEPDGIQFREGSFDGKATIESGARSISESSHDVAIGLVYGTPDHSGFECNLRGCTEAPRAVLSTAQLVAGSSNILSSPTASNETFYSLRTVGNEDYYTTGPTIDCARARMKHTCGQKNS
ncbi:hypothetical protein L218DRAFT_949743 [Marasmius fiardii PR-910]|nr:hypothetical protein L218DRAFT_949743 [Marasmius fiardii PR-910]